MIPAASGSPFLEIVSAIPGAATKTRALIKRNGEWLPILEHLNTLEVERDSHAKSVEDTIAALKDAVDVPSQPIQEALANTFMALLSSSACISFNICSHV